MNFIKKLKFETIIGIIIGIVAYSYIWFRISNINDYLLNPLSYFESPAVPFFIFILMFLNWLTEAYKWKILVANIKRISILKSGYSILIGLAYSVFTPNRVGELIGRPSVFETQLRKKVFLSAGIGSLSQLFVTIFMGVSAGFFFIFSDNFLFEKRGIFIPLLIAAFIIGILILFIILKPDRISVFIFKINFFLKFRENFEFIQTYTVWKMMVTIFLSILKYLIFSFQYYLLLRFFGSPINYFQAFIGISLSYLVSSGIPSITITELGIRGSVSMFFLGIYTDNQSAILAASSWLWIVNVAIPAFFGATVLFLRKTQKK